MTKYEHALKECPLISVDPEICSGQPCIKGTRIPVYCVLEVIFEYEDLRSATIAHPSLNIKQVKQAVYFAALMSKGEDND
jgi:uncharacterized protein (DUF433 family)